MYSKQEALLQRGSAMGKSHNGLDDRLDDLLIFTPKRDRYELTKCREQQLAEAE
jgi:hypothetical protein